uniref:Uncharacterized protein n=1 Tax=Tetradesmus obliquus TaxID=3088 RepID=A0A383VLQ2_TETOB|eukprot:jgi/Sobl393_1/5762/SZX66111.1
MQALPLTQQANKGTIVKRRVRSAAAKQLAGKATAKVVSAGRHADYMQLHDNPLQPATVKERHNLEADPRYRRTDFSAELAAEARLQFAACLAQGEARLPLARAALLIAAEDDAIASSSIVRFPVDAFMERITRLAHDTATALAAAAAAATPSSSSSSSSEQQWASLRGLPAEQVVAAIEHCLFKDHYQQQQQQQQQWYSGVRCAGFSMPAYGRSNLPKKALLDHPGVWEDARLGYLHEVLVKKRGCPAALVILYNEVMQQLLLMGAVGFAVTFDYGGFSRLPTATPLANLDVQQLILPPHLQQQQQQQQDLQPPAASPTSGAAAAAADASIGSCSAAVLNTCSSEALAELLRHLKRAYWPFPWDTNVDDPEKGGRGSLGGFRGAAKAALHSDDISAALRAISATAAHRLQRGIWTSPGAGDLSRCLAACERLVMLVGDEQPQERRDLGVLLLHAGQPAAAAAELAAYLDSVRSAGPRFGRSAAAAAADPVDVRFAQQLWKMLVLDTGIVPARELMSVGKVLAQGLPTSSSSSSDGYKPLTW